MAAVWSTWDKRSNQSSAEKFLAFSNRSNGWFRRSSGWYCCWNGWRFRLNGSCCRSNGWCLRSNGSCCRTNGFQWAFERIAVAVRTDSSSRSNGLLKKANVLFSRSNGMFSRSNGYRTVCKRLFRTVRKSVKVRFPRAGHIYKSPPNQRLARFMVLFNNLIQMLLSIYI